MRTSVVIATDGRAASLAATLQGLRRLDRADYEVIVVQGPTPDGTDDVLSAWLGRIKHVRCPERNLSCARNMGVAAAAGEVIAFLDDDAIPEPEWLEQLTAPFADPRTGVAGGFVLDHTGGRYQYRYAVVDRLAKPDPSWDRAAPELCFPSTARFPHPLGANSAFRRSALTEQQGFDQEFDYYLDETDMCCRLVDAGWHIAQVAGAHVHHKFQASALRTEKRVLSSWFSVVKNKAYFGLVNGRAHHSMTDILAAVSQFVEELRGSMEWAVSGGYLHAADRERFEQEADAALAEGLRRGLSGERRLVPADDFASPPAFLPFGEVPLSGGRHTYVFVSQEYPPAIVGGVGRYVHQLARSMAELGEHAHVVTKGAEMLTVDLEDGVWVHRVPPPHPRAHGGLPPHIQAHAEAVRDTVRSIQARRPVACAYAPIWDVEGSALLDTSGVPLVTGLQTTLRFWLDSNPAYANDPTFRADFVEPMLAGEIALLTRSDALHAISSAIVDEIETAYDLTLRPLSRVVPLGLADFTQAPATPTNLPGRPRILFVGRLESRKGVDVLLRAVRTILDRYPEATLDLVGDDTIPGPDGRTYRTAFASEPAPAALRSRVRFHGPVDEARLRGFYAECDLLVAPSRFESFGLVLLEGMIFGKPVVGCRAGGMVEVVEDGVTGLLAEPGDADSLAACIDRLVADPLLRRRLGEAGRQRYETHFTPEAMARGVREIMLDVAR